MTARTGLLTRGFRASRRRTAAGLGALLAALVLALVPLPPGAGQAQAAEHTGSAMTRSGAKGPYDDFSDLKVTVSQTEHLRAQGVQVTWTGGEPTGPGRNYLQVMQCWGDDPQGPTREQCVYGAGNVNRYGLYTSQRLLAVPDPAEKEYTEGPGGSTPFVPFKPVDGPATESNTDWTYFTQGDTNEQYFNQTQADGTGEVDFEVYSVQQSPALGCGDTEDGTVAPRSCWLVVVPRGDHEADGTQVPDGSMLDSSPLSTSNWDQRIVFPLEFDAVGTNCPADKPERRIIGAELATEAVSSWQTRLCAGGTARYSFTQSGEGHARDQITRPSDTAPGLALTVDPVRAADGAAPIVHAPVAIGGLAIGYFWEDPDISRGRIKELKLNQRLLAKILTESYVFDVRLMNGSQYTVPPHLVGNALNIRTDPEFQRLNPEFAENPNGAGKISVMMVQAANSDANRMVWKYLQANKEARDFLNGKPDPWGMKVNPYFKTLDLATDTALDYFPKVDPTTTEVSSQLGKISYGVTDRGPYTNDMHDAAQRTRHGASAEAMLISTDLPIRLTAEPVIQGNRRAYGIVDAASAARYQLDIASLPNADGQFVKPTAASLLKAESQMSESDVPGFKVPEPARAKDGAYPLTAVVYAAGSVDQAKDARTDYARFIRYAAGTGQTAGDAPGELPAGYAPLPAALREQAAAAADQLEKGQAAVPPGKDGAAAGGSGSGGGSGEAGGLGGPGGTGDPGGAGAAGGGAGPDAAGNPDAAASPGPGTGPQDPAKRNLASSGGLTPDEVLGIVRWVLLGVLVAGGTAALAGPLLLRLSARRAAAGAAGGTG